MEDKVIELTEEEKSNIKTRLSLLDRQKSALGTIRRQYLVSERKVLEAIEKTELEYVEFITLLSKEKEVLCIEVPSKEELGAAAGIAVGTASIAIVDEGEAKNIIKEITKKLSEQA